jgi:hypothetical protein
MAGSASQSIWLAAVPPGFRHPGGDRMLAEQDYERRNPAYAF